MPRNNHIAPPISGDVVRLTIVYLSQGQILESILDYQADALGVVGATELSNFLVAWSAANQVLLLNVLAPTCTLSFYIASLISRNDVRSQALTRNLVGTAGVSSLPIEMAAIGRKTTTLKGQHGAGRVFWPCVPNTFTTPATDPNLLNLVGTAAYGLLHTSLDNVVLAAPRGYSPCISTRPIPPNTLVSNVANNAIYNIIPLLGTQRRRREGRGK